MIELRDYLGAFFDEAWYPHRSCFVGGPVCYRHFHVGMLITIGGALCRIVEVVPLWGGEYKFDYIAIPATRQHDASPPDGCFTLTLIPISEGA